MRYPFGGLTRVVESIYQLSDATPIDHLCEFHSIPSTAWPPIIFLSRVPNLSLVASKSALRKALLATCIAESKDFHVSDLHKHFVLSSTFTTPMIIMVNNTHSPTFTPINLTPFMAKLPCCDCMYGTSHLYKSAVLQGGGNACNRSRHHSLHPPYQANSINFALYNKLEKNKKALNKIKEVNTRLRESISDIDSK